MQGREALRLGSQGAVEIPGEGAATRRRWGDYVGKNHKRQGQNGKNNNSSTIALMLQAHIHDGLNACGDRARHGLNRNPSTWGFSQAVFHIDGCDFSQYRHPMTTAEQLLSEIEAFLKRTGMAATTFGLEACKDAHAVRRLREGYGLTIRRADQMRGFMQAYRPFPPKRPKGNGRRNEPRASAA